MADPPEQATRAEPEAGRDDQPEQGAEPVAVVDLADAWDEEAEDGCDSGAVHRADTSSGVASAFRGSLARSTRLPACWFKKWHWRGGIDALGSGTGTGGTAILSEFLIILALILVNGFFAGAEIGVVSLRKTRLKELVETGSGSAKAVERLRAAPERFLATVQIGITVVGSAASAFGGASFAEDIEPFIAAIPGLAPYASQLSLLAVVALVSYLSLVIGELVPKSLALRSAERYAMLVGRPIWFLSKLARPLVWFLTASSNLVLRIFGDRTSFTESRLSPDELQQLLEEAARTGSLDPDAGSIASRAIDFGELTASEVMVPRNRVVGGERSTKPDELRRILLEEGHSRMPVYEGTIDNVVGYISIKDVVALAWEQQLIVLEDLIRPAWFVPETVLATDLLREMQARRLAIAIVVEESGGMAGIVTIEDLIEELVGEIFSEQDEPAPEALHRQPDGSVVVQAIMPIRDVNRALDLDLPEGDGWSTVAGLCIHLAGRIPEKGERLVAPDRTGLEVLEASARRVRLVRIMPPPSEESAPD